MAAPNLIPDESKEELNADYANNTLIQPTVWDVKLLFGELMPQGKQGVDWHTVITLPWAHAKLFSYFLQLNIAAHELENGKIPIPPAMVPPSPEVDTIANTSTDPRAKALYDLVVEYHNKFIATL